MQEKTKIIRSILAAKALKKPYKINFAITSCCNSHCQTCNVWRKFKKNPEIIKSDLSLKEIEKIFKTFPKSIIWLSLSGGEPFLRDDLVLICKKAVENIPSLYLISIPSNGLLEKNIVEKTKQILKLPLKNLFLNFSLDGPPPLHDKIRGLPGSFQKTWSTYQKILALSKKEPRLSVNIETTISAYNINHLESFLKKLTKNGHQVTITLAHTGYLYKSTPTNKKFTQLGQSEKKMKKITNLIKKKLAFTSPLGLIQRLYLDKIPSFYQNPQKQPLPCTALKNSFAIDAQGNITPCFMWGKILGNLKDFDGNFEKFLKTKQSAIAKTRKMIKNQQCPNCWTPCEAYQGIINCFFVIPCLKNLLRFRAHK